MKRLLLAGVAVVALSLMSSVHADIVNIDTLGFNTNGVAFDATNQANASGVLYNGVAPGGADVVGDPFDVLLTYNNLDLDGDGTANDSVTFNINITTGAGTQRLFNQGFHTNWGTLDDMVVSVTSVSGTTTDLGDTIVFDGFTGAAVGAGQAAGDIDINVDINGVTSTLTGNNGGSFQFVQSFQDFAPTPTVSFSNSILNSTPTPGPTLVARNFDLQFSTIPAVPEPSSLAVVGVLGLLVLRRRK